MRFFLAFLLIISFAANAADILLTWEPPTEREDGSQIEQIDRYNLYTTFNNVLQDVNEIAGDATSFQLSEVEAGTYTFQISIVEFGQEGLLSDPISLNINDKIIAKAGKIIVTVQVVE